MNILAIPVALILMISLPSCSIYHNRPPTMGADPPLTGGEGIALINELQSAFVVVHTPNVAGSWSGCEDTMPSHQEFESAPYHRHVKSEGPKPFQCVIYKPNPSPIEVQNHLEAGLALTDLYCDIYFRRISQHSSERRFSRGLVNDVGAAVTAILGLSKVSSPLTGGIGAGFGLADSSFRNYDDAFLISADISTLQSKVYVEQQKFRSTMKSKSPMTRYGQANSAILQYANFCSYTGMRGIINASLSQTTASAGQ